MAGVLQSVVASFASLLAPDRESHILVLGLDNAGKGTLLRKMGVSDVQVGHRDGASTGKLRGCGRVTCMRYWDLGGRMPFRAARRKHFEQVDALIFVVDSADRRRMVEAGGELLDLVQEEGLAGVPLLVVANKQDLLTAQSGEELASALGLDPPFGPPCTVCEISARTGQGVDDVWAWLRAQLGGGGPGAADAAESKSAPDGSCSDSDAVSTADTESERLTAGLTGS
mmetsp:Transcript_15122/g.43573  ORF Transcript_15122/g.43573 Transcript_15122/m.43573 type:complete len:227 (-) Transcript_15122:161-841(-)